MNKNLKAKVLILDIETCPILASVWDIWNQNIALNQIEQDWSILAWSAKWLGEPKSKIKYADQRNASNMRDDKELLKGIWNLMNEADIIITQNGKRFDIKKLFSRFIINGMTKPSGFKQIDTAEIAKQNFGFTSNKLEYLSDKLCKKYKKSKHKKFPGHELWSECLKGNQSAWKEMEHYNKHDILATEELYLKLRPFITNHINFNLYTDEELNHCGACGSHRLVKNGFKFTSKGKYQRYVCKACGSEARDSKNLFSKEKRDSLKVNS